MSKMKKLLVSLCALLAVCASANAQGMTATLQQGDRMTPFYGPDAFVQAYNAAPQKGAVITLSSGEFNTVDSIMKEVTIIGNGYRDNKTVLKGRNFDSYIIHGTALSISLVIRANNVTLEGLEMHCVMIRNTNHLTIKHCSIYNLWGETNNSQSTQILPAQHKNTIVDQCIIGVEFANSGENYCIKNSIVTIFMARNNGDAVNTLISNCIIGCTNSESATLLPHAVYKNCFMGTAFSANENIVYDCSTESGYEFYNNVFFGGVSPSSSLNLKDGYYKIVLTKNQDSVSRTPELYWSESNTCKGNTAASYNAVFGDSDEENPLLAPIITTIKGDDGTVVGPYGGTGFSVNPSIPRIVDSKIDSITDAEGKLNVKIKVEVNQ